MIGQYYLIVANKSLIIFPKQMTSVKNLVKNYNQIFSYELGTIKGINAKVNIETNSQPKFMKARSVSFALKEVIKAKIDRMEKDKILKPVPYSEWPSPIIIVPKTRWDH